MASACIPDPRAMVPIPNGSGSGNGIGIGIGNGHGIARFLWTPRNGRKLPD